MKKNLLITSLISILSISTIAGCNNTNTSSTSSSTNQITSSSSTSLVSDETKLENMLIKLRNGFKLEGTINQAAKYLDSAQGNPTGIEMNNVYEATYIYQNGEENGYSSYVTATAEDGTKDVMLDNIAFEGEDGYAYFYQLNYDNTLQKIPLYENSTGALVNFNYYCINPFNMILKEDFIKVDDSTYKLNNAKSTIFASNLLGDVDEAYYDVIDTCEFKMENGEFVSLKIIPKPAYGSTTDYETWQTIYYVLDQIATFDIKEAGSAIVAKPAVKETKEEHANLQAALDKFDSRNFTAHYEITFFEDGEEISTKNYGSFYYTGEHAYLSYNEDQSEPSADNDVLLYQYEGKEYLTPLAYSEGISTNGQPVFTYGAATNYHANLSNLTYDQVIPEIGAVDAAIFEYDSFRDIYGICEEMKSYIASIAFFPPFNTITEELNGNGNKFRIRLTDSGDIEYVSFGYSMDYFLFTRSAEVELIFENVGTTVLPHDLVVE